MANKIGIVLALDGEQQFTQGMKNAQQSAKLLKTNLTQLSTEFKGNANSMEALRAKQEALKNLQEGYTRVLTAAKTGQSQAKKAYQEQAKAVEKLRKEYEDAKKALDQMEKEGKQGTDAYKKQKAEVDKLSKAVDQQTANYLKAEGRLSQWDAKVAQAESDIKKNSAALDQNSQYLDEAAKSADGCATSIDKMGDEVQDTTDDLDEGGKSLKDFLMYTAGNLAASAIKEVGQMAKEAAKYVIDVGSKFEASMSKVAALSGASTTELAAMEEMAKQLGSSTMFSASEVADGFSYMALAGWSAQQSLDAMPGILDLAAASQMDLAEASDMVTDYLSAFGMEASDATKMADMMAYAQANSNTSAQQLGEAYGNCAANLHAAGQDMETTTALLEAFANQGIKGSEAGTKLSAIMRDITAKMKDGKIQIGDTAVEVMDANGNFRDLTDILTDVETATEGMGTAEKAAALSTTFTSKSVSGLNMILTEGMDKVSGYEEALRSSDGAASGMAKTMQDNLQGKVTAFNSALEGLGIALYNYFGGPLSGVVGLATQLISGITEALTPQKSALQSFSDETARMNKEVQETLKTASETVENGKKKAEEVAVVGEEINGILTACEQFNVVSLDDGTTQIRNASGDVVLELEKIDEQVVVTKGAIGTLNSVTLEDGTKQITNDTGDVVAAFQKIDGQVVVTEGAFAGFTGEELADGTTVIKNSTGEVVLAFQDIDGQIVITEGALTDFDTSGMSVDQVVSKALTAQNAIGYIKEEAESTEDKLSKFAERGINTSGVSHGKAAIVQIFDEAGQEVDAFSTTVSESGNVDIPTDKLEKGVTGIVTTFDPATQKVQSFKTDLKSLEGVDLNVNNLAGSFDRVANSVNKTYVITDAYTKAKMDTYVSNMSGVVDGLSEAWNSNTGELSANKKQIDEWFSSAQNLILYDAFNEAYNQTLEAYANSNVVLTRLKSEQKELIRQFSEAQGLEKPLQSYDEWLEYCNEGTHVLQGSASDLYQEIKTKQADIDGAIETVKDAKEEVDTTGAAMLEARDAVDATTKAMTEMGESAEGSGEAIAGAGNAAETAGDQIQGMGEDAEDAEEAVKEFGISAEQQAKNLKAAYKDASNAIKDAVEDAKASAKSAFSINPFESWNVNDEHGMDSFTKAMEEQIASMQNYASNLQTVSEHVGQEITPEFLEYLEGLGEDGAKLLADIAKEFDENGDPKKVQEIVDQYTEALNAQEEIARVTAANALAMKLGMKEFGSTEEEWADVTQSLHEGIDSWGTELDQGLKSGLDTAIETAKQMGVKIPDGMMEAIEQGSTDPEQAITYMTQLIEQAISGHQQGLIEAAAQCGIEIPEELTTAITEGGPAAEEAWKQVVQLISGAEVDTSASKQTGTELVENTTEGISEGQGEAESAAEMVSEAAGTAIGTAVEKFRSAGTLAGVAFRTAINNYAGTAAGAADAMATQAATAAGNHTGEFSSSGSSSSQSFVSGMNSVDSTGAGNTLASSALNGASGYYDSFYSIGSNLGSGLNAGISAWTSTIAETAAAAVTNAAAAARAAADVNSPSKLFRDQVGKPIGEGIAVGIEKTSGLSVDAAEAQMNQVLARLQQWLGRNRKQIEATGATMSEAVSYGWQTLAEQELKNGFGIAKTTTTGTGDDKKTEKKSAETYSKEVLSAAKQYMDNVKVLFDVSDAEEEEYWTNVQKHLTRGTQAWFDATERINELRKSQAEAAQRAAEEEAEAAQRAAEEEAEAAQKAAEAEEERKRAIRQANADVLSNAETTMRHQQILHDVSLQEQLEYWQSVRKQLIKGSDEWYEATATIKDIRKQIREEQAKTRKQAAEAQAQTYEDILKSAEEYVRQQKSRNKMSIKEEEQYWIEIRKQLKKGSEEYKKATENIQAARAQVGLVSTAETMLDTYQTYFDMSARAEMQYWAAVRKQYRAGTEERLKADKQYFTAQKNYTSQLTKLSEDYANNKAAIIKSRDDQIAEAEEKLADRIKSINTQLADDIAKVNENRYNRIKELHENYRNAVASRKDEILHSFDIFSAFESSSATGADLLFNMQSQAAGYEDWAASIKKLRKKGVLSDALMSEIEAKGPQDSAAVHALLQVSKSQLQQYQDAYDRREAVAQSQAEKENAQLLKDTAAEIREVKAAAKDEIAKLREAAKADRAAARSETKAEIKSLKTETSTKLKELKSTYVSSKNELKTAIDKDILSLAKSIKTIASDETTKLITALYKPVITASSKKTTTSKALISMLTGDAFASGTPALKDWYAWMDEAGIGSEMIVRKSDGARLNTNVQPGDAIVPAANTANLWDWSEFNPKDLISGLRAQQASLTAYINDVMSGVASMAALNARVLTSGGSMMNGGNDAGSQLMMSMLALMQQYMPYMAERQTLSVDGRELASATSEYMSEELAMRSRRRR